MKLPTTNQEQDVGKFPVARALLSDYPDSMDRDPSSKIVADNLQRLLSAANISARTLALNVGMGESSVYDILKGRSSSPKVATVAKLARGLGVPLSELFLTEEEVEAQRELLRAFQTLSPDEQRKLTQVARAWRLD